VSYDRDGLLSDSQRYNQNGVGSRRHHCEADIKLSWIADGSFLYVGKDKFENEDLIKYGWPEDIWFHVDNISSPHVYVRLGPVSAQKSCN
jgi:predicted ribosome quality control (RQC) complex YloA/Tae2 family protein